MTENRAPIPPWSVVRGFYFQRRFARKMFLSAEMRVYTSMQTTSASRGVKEDDP